MRRLICFTMVSVAAMTCALGAPQLRNNIAALVNDSIITRQQIEERIKSSIDVLRRTFLRQPEVLQKKVAEAYDDGLQQLLERELILDDFKKSGLVMPEGMLESEIADRIREKYLGDRMSFTRTLHAQGTTYETFKERVREEMILRIMLQRNLQSATLISPAKIERFYMEHLDTFKVGEEVKLRMIVLGKASGTTSAEIKHLADEVLSKIRGGASFAEMASVYSEGSQRRANGDWGWVEKTKLNKGLGEVAFGLSPGQVSHLLGVAVDGEDGYWLYQYDQEGQLATGRHYDKKEQFLEEKKFEPTAVPPVAPQEFYIMSIEARQPPRTLPLTEVQEQIEKDLLVQEHERLRKEWINRLKDKAFVRYF